MNEEAIILFLFIKDFFNSYILIYLAWSFLSRKAL